MVTWESVALVLVGGAIGVAGTVLATWFQHRFSRIEREAAENTARRERGAAMVGPLGIFLSDADPMRLGANAGPKSQEQLDALRRKWEERRDQLAVYAAAHPSAEVGEIAAKLTTAVGNALTSAAWFVHGLLAPGQTSGGPEILETAKRDHAEARKLTDSLLVMIRWDD